MVADVKSISRLKYAGQIRRYRVEIIGPAGAGKSTLFRALKLSMPEVRGEDLPPVWKFSYLSFFVKNIFTLVPTLWRLQGKGDRNLTRRELAWMAMLNGWPEILRRKSPQDSDIFLFDQGPIFLMAILQGFGPTSLQNHSIQNWWEKIYRQWQDVLDLVIWLDTEDEVLIKRIRFREQDHLMKEKSNEEIAGFLSIYRKVYEDVIGNLTTKNPKIRVVRVDSAFSSVDEIVSRVLTEINT